MGEDIIFMWFMGPNRIWAGYEGFFMEFDLSFFTLDADQPSRPKLLLAHGVFGLRPRSIW